MCLFLVFQAADVRHDDDDGCDTTVAFHGDNIKGKLEQKSISMTNSRVDLINHQTKEKRQIFEELIYENIYDVVLPNTKWGYHKDPEERRYIAFTMFDAIKMNCAVAIKITNAFELKVYTNGVHKTSKILTELSVDILTNIIKQINESVEKEMETKHL